LGRGRPKPLGAHEMGGLGRHRKPRSNPKRSPTRGPSLDSVTPHGMSVVGDSTLIPDGRTGDRGREATRTRRAGTK
jgi:hypothetical protein